MLAGSSFLTKFINILVKDPDSSRCMQLLKYCSICQPKKESMVAFHPHKVVQNIQKHILSVVSLFLKIIMGVVKKQFNNSTR